MREIKIEPNNNGYRPIAVLSYGAPGTSKTFFAATFPKPLFLSDVTERGWTTIQTMSPKNWYDEKTAPVVWGIERVSDIPDAIGKLENELKATPGKYQTVVVDSATFYTDLFLNEMIRAQGNKPDTRAVYGALKNHMHNLRVKLQSLPLNVVWLALETKPEVGETGGPAIAGSAAGAIAAGTDHIFYHRKRRDKDGTIYEIHTTNYGPYIARSRDGGVLPPVLENYTYKDLAGLLKIGAPPK